MPVRAKRASAQRAAKTSGVPRLGSLPEWNLADLYGGIDDPQVKRDLDRADAESVSFEQAFKGKLAALADETAPRAGVVGGAKRYTARDPLLGPALSSAGLVPS